MKTPKNKIGAEARMSLKTICKKENHINLPLVWYIGKIES